MSSYQYYDFYSIDRPLSQDEMEEVRGFSSRVNPSSRRATFEYNYSDFRYDEEDVLAGYFDICLYVSSWGNRRLMMKFPEDLVSKEDLKAYECEIEYDFIMCLRVFSKGSFVFIDFNLCNDYGDWIDAESMLDDLIPLRAQILQGDYRVLYLAWLHLASLSPEYEYDDEYDDRDADKLIEPNVPHNLKDLDYSLKSFISFWNIDIDMISAASERSDTRAEIKPEDLIHRLAQLSAKEKDEFLALLLTNEGKAGLRLKKRLFALGPAKPLKQQEARSIREIKERHLHHEQIRIAKKEKEAEEARIRRMEKIMTQEESMWADAKSNALLKSSKGYKKATRLLKDLKEYYDYRQKEGTFSQLLGVFLDNHGKSLAFRKRLKAAEVF